MELEDFNEIDLEGFVDDEATLQLESEGSDLEETNVQFHISDDDDDLFDDSQTRGRTKQKHGDNGSNDNSGLKNDQEEFLSLFSSNENTNTKNKNKDKTKSAERSFISSTNDKIAHYLSLRERRLAKKRRRNADDPYIKDYDKWWKFINTQNENEVKEQEKKAQQAKKRRRLSASKGGVNFTSLKISRVILRAIRDLGWNEPTPVQMQSIPHGLKGKDLLVNAVTGSGKTAAFMIPILERLIFTEYTIAKKFAEKAQDEEDEFADNGNNYLLSKLALNIGNVNSKALPMNEKHGRGAASRVLVVTPTRELAAQCLAMTRKLAKFTKIQIGLVVGGLSIEEQEEFLRRKPDIIICTPGRMIDLVRNSRGITLEDIEVLVLDEADRLLDMGFRPEIEELVSHVPSRRQTLLFSATLSDNVLRLAKFSLNKAERICVDPTLCMADHLTQEFVRIHVGQEKFRKAMLLSVCLKTYKRRTIIFCRTKVETHNLRLIFGLMGLKAGELHGNMSQLDRLEALEAFRESRVDFLLCTDVAARGLDISGVETVINIEFPTNVKTYIHRVGRTARAGSFGHSLTFVGEGRRRILKKLMNDASNTNLGSLKTRILNQEFVLWCYNEILTMQSDLKMLIRDENSERELRIASRKLQTSENLLQHSEKILSRPKKTWHMNSVEKKIQRSLAHREDLGNDFAKELEYKIEQRKKLNEIRKKKQKLIEMKKRGELEDYDEQNINKLLHNEEIFGKKFKSVEKERQLIKLKRKKDQQHRKKELKFAKQVFKEAMGKYKQKKRLEKQENRTKYGNDLVSMNDMDGYDDRKKSNRIVFDGNSNRKKKKYSRIDALGIREFKKMKMIEKTQQKNLRKRIKSKTKRKTIHAKRRGKR